MDLPQDLRIIHEPARLGILGMLYRQTDLGFTALRDALELTPGNLASHAARLQDAGLLLGRDALTNEGFERRFQMTTLGLATFERYLAFLEAFLAANRTIPPGRRSTAGQPAQPGSPRSRRDRRQAMLASD